MSTLRRFHEDDRGVMMITGVVMAAFMIGAVWFIWGVGQAAVFRENMQAGADAAAYSVSVYDARGMNIIVMINLIMSVVLTVLVVVRLVQLIVFAVNIISCLFFWTGIGAAVCAATTSAEAPIDRTVNTVAQVVNKVLTVLSLTESGTALLWPSLAAGMSTTASAAYKPDVAGTFALGTSNVPLQGATDLAHQVGLSFFDFSAARPVSFENVRNSFNVAENGLFCNYGGKFMLPVESDAYEDLCARAGANIVYAHTGLLQLFPLPPGVDVLRGEILKFFDQWFGGAMASLARQFSPFFCQDDAAAIESLVTKLIGLGGGGSGDSDADLKALCDKNRKTGQPKGQAKGPKRLEGGQPEPATTDAQYKQCLKANENTKRLSNKTGGKRFGWTETCSKTLYSKATMLDVNFQNWGFAFGSYSDKSARTVGTATALDPKGGRGAVAPASKGADMQVAQSEFYYEPKSAGETQAAEQAEPGLSAASKGDTGLDNTMWNMRWRARLRRVRAPQIGFGDAAAGFVDSFAKALGGKVVDGRLGGQGGEIVDKGVGTVTEFLTKPLKGQGTVTIGGHVVTPELVH